MSSRYHESIAASSGIFSKIIRGEIPSFKLAETEFSYAFMDIGPISLGHCLIIPKYEVSLVNFGARANWTTEGQLITSSSG